MSEAGTVQKSSESASSLVGCRLTEFVAVVAAAAAVAVVRALMARMVGVVREGRRGGNDFAVCPDRSFRPREMVNEKARPAAIPLPLIKIRLRGNN